MTILDFMHACETLVITRIDRLARSLRDLQVIADRLEATEQPVDTSTAAGKAFFDMLGVFAQSKPTCGASGMLKVSPQPGNVASTKGTHRRLIAQKSFACNRSGTQQDRRDLGISRGRSAKVFPNEQGKPHHPFDVERIPIAAASSLPPTM
ncbi:hypothetical protein HNQ71_006478 [Mesorhizobium sangaii]|uniref:Resolvase/invertase-type recombinase catalytic domain-containing protein n=1 Tax=Mesorhizobium sangaii TaxID=505389 RepID=A0A841PUD5_9HYPH|nr:hypothetical protein [Mesorhizobium sangaii]